MRVRVGTTSWSYEDWVGPFYPPGTPMDERLPRYAKVFDLVEADSTFYRMPSLDMVRRWAEATPPGFLFTVKLGRRITHEAGLVGEDEYLKAFLERLQPLRDANKLAAVLAQFPARFRREKSAPALRPFLERWPRDIRLAMEFRNKGWFVSDTYDALRDHKASLVWWFREDGAAPPEVTSDFLYLRFVGEHDFERNDKLQKDLRPVMDEARRRLLAAPQELDAFVLLSNHFMGFGPETAAIMCEVLGLPRPDLAAARKGTKQRPTLGDFA